MIKMCKVFAMLAGIGLLAAVPSAVFAVCPDTEALWNGGGGWFTNCPDLNPVTAYAYAVGAQATINTNGLDIACRDQNGFTGGQHAFCGDLPACGSAGDGNVTVLFNWGGSGSFLGCPNPTYLPDTGRNVLQIVANNGASALVSVNFEPGTQTYLIETAMQTTDGATFTPISCTLDNAPHLVSATAGTGLSISQVCVNVPQPKVTSDCDPGTYASLFLPGACAVSAAPAVTRGKAYVATGDCRLGPTDNRLSNTAVWGPGVTPDGTGLACLPVTVPAGQCAFVGVSGLVTGGVETGAPLGTIVVSGDPTAASPKVLIDKVSHATGKVSVDFHTTSELGVVGFDILAGKRQLNAQLIAATGKNGAGANYHFEIDRGALRNDRTIVVQARTSSGGVISSNPATLSK